MNISELARVTATTAPAIRYYERIGLVPPPPRTEGNYREYTDEHVKRLLFVRHARELDFSIEQTRALLHLADGREQPCEAVFAIATEHLLKVKQKISQLVALRRKLEAIVDQCRHGTVADCGILEALAP